WFRIQSMRSRKYMVSNPAGEEKAGSS
uniref:Uncharacterized protein n=1 Tax=Anopheles atroparvus TaxID=41427 RepID=A0AAG5DU39_ANOAO